MKTAMQNLDSVLAEIIDKDSSEVDQKRENANIDADSPMGAMLKIGSEASKAYYQDFVLNADYMQLHKDGWIHIHDLDFYKLTFNCCQIDLTKLFSGGFSIGPGGSIREPQSIESYASLACIVIQGNQNEMFGGQAIPKFDYDMAPGVAKSYRKNFRKVLAEICEDFLYDFTNETADNEVRVNHGLIYKSFAEEAVRRTEDTLGRKVSLSGDEDMDSMLAVQVCHLSPKAGLEEAKRIIKLTRRRTFFRTSEQVHQAMESLVHNLNTLHSRAGAQVPFSSLNYGTDTSPEGRMVVKNLLIATIEGLGNGETPIFPVQIFKVKDGVNYNMGDPNFDLFRLAMKCSTQRMFPNYAFLDSPYNAQYYKPGHPETEVAYMGCRTRVIGNNYDPAKEQCASRGNLSFTSINLPRLAIEAHGDIKKFYSDLDALMERVIQQLLDRFEIIAKKRVFNFSFLIGQGIWLDSEKLNWNDSIREVLKHGSMAIGFIGLAEALVALIGKHHGESEEAQKLGLEIIGHMKDFTDKKSEEMGLTFGIIGTPAEGLSGRFVRIDKKCYGEIPGVTDRDYYTNSSHIPVYFPITAYRKIQLEAPYHALENSGHIAYVEVDGDISSNLPAFERIVRTMHDFNVGYGAINLPIDQDPVCGYHGIIGDECPKCHRREGDGKPRFIRIRRVTGYLSDANNRFNSAKTAEEHDRVKHSL